MAMSKATTLPVVGVILLAVLTHFYWHSLVEVVQVNWKQLSESEQFNKQIKQVHEAASSEKKDEEGVRSLKDASTVGAIDVVNPSSSLERPLQSSHVAMPDPIDSVAAQPVSDSDNIAAGQEQQRETRDDGNDENSNVNGTQSNVDRLAALLKQQRCSNLTRPAFDEERQKWLPVNDRPMNVFSAYYDPRPLLHEQALIRLIAHGLQDEYNQVDTFYCQLWYDGFPEAVVTGPAEWKRNYRSTLYHDEYTAHFVLCPLPEDVTDVPKYVSVVATACDTPSNTHLILNRQAEYPLRGMGVCISPLYNRYDDALQVIELMELHRLMGVQRFTMYKHSISAPMDKILATYVDEGFLELVDWSLDDILDKKLNYFDQRSAINDCLYRNMMRVSYVSVTDLDEFIVPRKYNAWPDMIDYLEVSSKEPIGAFLFQHYYFEKSIYEGVEPPLVSLTRLMRTSTVFPAGKIRSKTIHNVQRTIMIDIHFGLEYVDGWTELLVEPEIAALNHYRPYPLEIIKKQRDTLTFVEDRLVYRYSEALTQAYLNRTKLI